jgi:hypothetical protein
VHQLVTRIEKRYHVVGNDNDNDIDGNDDDDDSDDEHDHDGDDDNDNCYGILTMITRITPKDHSTVPMTGFQSKNQVSTIQSRVKDVLRLQPALRVGRGVKPRNCHPYINCKCK